MRVAPDGVSPYWDAHVATCARGRSISISVVTSTDMTRVAWGRSPPAYGAVAKGIRPSGVTQEVSGRRSGAARKEAATCWPQRLRSVAWLSPPKLTCCERGKRRRAERAQAGGVEESNSADMNSVRTVLPTGRLKAGGACGPPHASPQAWLGDPFEAADQLHQPGDEALLVARQLERAPPLGHPDLVAAGDQLRRQDHRADL